MPNALCIDNDYHSKLTKYTVQFKFLSKDLEWIILEAHLQA